MNNKYLVLFTTIIFTFFLFVNNVSARGDETIYDFALLTSSENSERIKLDTPYAMLFSKDHSKVYLVGINGGDEAVDIFLNALANMIVFKEMGYDKAANTARDGVISRLRAASFIYEAIPVVYDKNNKQVIYTITKNVSSDSIINNIEELFSCLVLEKRNLESSMIKVLSDLVGPINMLSLDFGGANTLNIRPAFIIFGSGLLWNDEYENFIKTLPEI
jgi:hypothetical protein